MKSLIKIIFYIATKYSKSIGQNVFLVFLNQRTETYATCKIMLDIAIYRET